MKTREINVNYEWGKLCEVIVGIGEGLLIPTHCENINFLCDQHFIETMQNLGGKSADEMTPGLTAEVVEQIEGLVNVLEQHGVIVHRPRPLTCAESHYLDFVQEGQMQIFARDPLLVVGNHVIETSLKVPMRAKESFPLRDVIRHRLVGTSANYFATPIPSPDFVEGETYLEGGDVLLNGKEVYVGNSGKATSRAGIDWLQHVLDPHYQVNEILISSEFRHLDSVMALLRPRLGLLCREALRSRLPRSLNDWEFINVPIEDAKKMATNVLVLDSETLIMDPQHKKIIDRVRQRGQTVLEVPFDKVADWGGGFRRALHPVVREDRN